MRTAPHVRHLAKIALLRKAGAHAPERIAANDEAPLNHEDAAQEVALRSRPQSERQQIRRRLRVKRPPHRDPHRRV